MGKTNKSYLIISKQTTSESYAAEEDAHRCLKHDLWRVYDRVLNNRPRTTNTVEGWHNAFSQSLGQSQANVWTFVDCLKREEAMTRLTIAQIQAGFPAPVQKRMYRNVNEQLSNIVVDCDNRDRIYYLRAISYVI